MATESIARRTNSMANHRDAEAMRKLHAAGLVDNANLLDRLRSQTLGSAGLVIKAGGGVLTKAGSTFYYTAAGVLVKKAANTDMAALSGTVTNTKFNVYVHFGDASGTLTTVMGTEGASLAAVVWPAFPAGKACIGFTIINPTGTGNFVGNTTAQDDATVAPNAAYVNTQGAFDPVTTLTTLA